MRSWVRGVVPEEGIAIAIGDSWVFAVDGGHRGRCQQWIQRLFLAAGDWCINHKRKGDVTEGEIDAEKNINLIK